VIGVFLDGGNVYNETLGLVFHPGTFMVGASGHPILFELLDCQGQGYTSRENSRWSNLLYGPYGSAPPKYFVVEPTVVAVPELATLSRFNPGPGNCQSYDGLVHAGDLLVSPFTEAIPFPVPLLEPLRVAPAP
jgi:hypothetical protein